MPHEEACHGVAHALEILDLGLGRRRVSLASPGSWWLLGRLWPAGPSRRCQLSGWRLLRSRRHLRSPARVAFALALAVAAFEVLAMPFGRACLLVVVRVVDTLHRHGSLPQLAFQCWDRAHRHRCSAQWSGHRRLSLLDQFHLRIDGIQFLGGFVKVLRIRSARAGESSSAAGRVGRE